MEEMPQHQDARRWLEGVLTDVPPVGLPWPSLLAFVRIGTNPRAFQRPASTRTAWRIVEQWLAAEPSWIPSPTDRHAEILARMLEHVDRPALVSDAHLASLAVEHGLEVCSTDRDFARFPGVRWRNPLDAG
jgi:uncharacterized protein